jgi:hypothetical protein
MSIEELLKGLRNLLEALTYKKLMKQVAEP